MKSHPKRTEMKKGKKKIPPGTEASEQALGTLKWDSPMLLSANSLRRNFYLGFLKPQEDAGRML